MQTIGGCARRFGVFLVVLALPAGGCRCGAGGTDGSSSDGGGGGGTDAAGDAGAGADAGVADGGAADAGTTVLPTGSVTLGGAVACGPGAAPGATCTNATVSCPGLPDLGVEIAVAEPAGGATAGTVFMIYGGGGTVYFDEGFPPEYLAGGFRLVQVRFASAWEESPSGIKAAACRPATLIQWAFDGPHGASRAEGFCAHGHSGGAGAVSYALAHYGEEAILDYVVVDAGPVFGRIDYGCEPDLKGTGATTRAVCPELAAGPFAYGGASNLVDDWEATSTCGVPYGDSTPADQARWAADSVVSPGADYDYPQTEVGFWYCANMSNEAAGLGSFYADEVTSAHTVTCVTGSCAVEPPWSDPGGFAAMVAGLSAGCVPRHQ